jgi:tetratricopeptide (TPR) repeat protein
MFNEQEIKNLIDKSYTQAIDLLKANNLRLAELLLEQAIKITNDNRIVELLAITKYQVNKFYEAISLYLMLPTPSAEIYNNLALCYSKIGDFSTSIKYSEKALDLEDNFVFENNLALTYRIKGDLHLAKRILHNSVLRHPNADGYALLCGCYGQENNLHEATVCAIKGLEINSNHAGLHVDLAYIHHLNGNLQQAWEEYEYRKVCFPEVQQWLLRYCPEKEWKGQSLENKRIVLYSEQGLGDAIQFIRYVPLLEGATIIFHGNLALKELLAPYYDEFVDIEHEFSNYDYHASLISLPFLTKKEGICAPYLKANSINYEKYKDIFKVGLCWAGSPYHPNDFNRSCHLNKFEEISKIEGLSLFSLQKDTRVRQYKNNQTIDFSENAEKIIDMSFHMNNFQETAEVIAGLDLVVSVDTSVVHLAGALGKETWVLIPYQPDWRWGINKETSNWYPSLRLFRQKSPGNWDDVIEDIYNLLKRK